MLKCSKQQTNQELSNQVEEFVSNYPRILENICNRYENEIVGRHVKPHLHCFRRRKRRVTPSTPRDSENGDVDVDRENLYAITPSQSVFMRHGIESLGGSFLLTKNSLYGIKELFNEDDDEIVVERQTTTSPLEIERPLTIWENHDPCAIVDEDDPVEGSEPPATSRSKGLEPRGQSLASIVRASSDDGIKDENENDENVAPSPELPILVHLPKENGNENVQNIDESPDKPNEGEIPLETQRKLLARTF